MKDKNDKDKNNKEDNILQQNKMASDAAECKTNSTKRCGCAFRSFAIIVLAVLASLLGTYFFVQHYCIEFLENSKKEALKIAENNRLHFESNLNKINDELSTLRGELSAIKGDMSKRDVETEKVVVTEVVENKRSDIRKKWKVWMALKSKMEASESFDKELEEFNFAFSHDKELIEIVGDLAKGINVVCPVNDDRSDVISVCKRYLKKIICIKKIDYRKLLEVSGYVLSSINENSAR